VRVIWNDENLSKFEITLTLVLSRRTGRGDQKLTRRLRATSAAISSLAMQTLLTHRLWEGLAPLATGDESGDVPTLTVYPVSSDKPRAAIIVLPGGGYGNLAPHEGEPVAQWLNTLGVVGLVLKYRHAPRYRHPAPLLDIQRAVRTVRAMADKWQVDPSRVGVLGFSAGGHLCASVSNLFDDGNPTAADPFDRPSCRPDVSIPTYPVITLSQPYMHKGSRDNLLGPGASQDLAVSLSMETRVTPRTPPTFIFHTVEDAVVPIENALSYAMALRTAGVPFELHAYERGRHGVGLASDNAVLRTWCDLCAAWLSSRDFCTLRNS
jgi:acetyl esterase/lipase